MAEDLRSRQELHERRFRNALDAVRGFSVEEYEARRRRGDFGLDAPGVRELPSAVHPAPDAPDDFTVAAVDGSHIDVDRHLAARCFLVNTGSAALTYGTSPGAELEGRARLYAKAEEMIIRDPDGSGQQRVEGAVLGAKRTVEEMRRLVEVAQSLPDDAPVLALIDGPLVMLGLVGRGYGDYVRRELVEDGFAGSLEELRLLAEERPLALAGYVSMPGYGDVTSALRYAVCERPDPSAPCASASEACGRCVEGILDRVMFSALLEPGERSGLFTASSRVIDNHYRGNEIDFFYLNVGDEVARVEVPSWTGRDEAAIGLAHSLIVDQVDRGRGYPVSLMEAHEKAVITGADRSYFNDLVERALHDHGIRVFTSEKARSKRLRWL